MNTNYTSFLDQLLVLSIQQEVEIYTNLGPASSYFGCHCEFLMDLPYHKTCPFQLKQTYLLHPICNGMNIVLARLKLLLVFYFCTENCKIKLLIPTKYKKLTNNGKWVRKTKVVQRFYHVSNNCQQQFVKIIISVS